MADLLTNGLMLAAAVFELQTNYVTTRVATPVTGFTNTTVYYEQYPVVDLVEFRYDLIDGPESRREKRRVFMPDLTAKLPWRWWPTNAPPSPLGPPLMLPLRHRHDAIVVPIPPLPPQ